MQQKIVVVKQGYLFPDLADNAPRRSMALTPVRPICGWSGFPIGGWCVRSGR